MAVEPRYQFRDLPTFSGDINEDPQYFIHKFETFLRYINLTVADGQAVENALTHLGTCLYKDARVWFKTHVGPPRPPAERRTKAQYDQSVGDFIQTFHPMGKTKNQLDLSWESLQWNPQIETIHQFISKLKNLASVIGKTEADQAYRLKKSLPPELRKIIMTCNSVDSIVDIINQMQAMNSLGLNPTTPAVATNTPAMPFMATQSNMTEKKVSFSDQLNSQMSDPLLQSLHVITHKLDSCVTGMNNLRTDLRNDCDRSRNRDRSGDDYYYRDRSSKRDRDRHYRDRDYRSDYRESRDYKYRDRDYDRPRNYDRTRSSRSPDKVHVMTDVLDTLTDTLND